MLSSRSLLYSLSFCFLIIRRPPRSTLSSSSAASDVYKRQLTIKCAELVRVVLESGDELCQANVEALEKMLGLLTGKETVQKGRQKVSAGLTESSSGRGGGTGVDGLRTAADWNAGGLSSGDAHIQAPSLFEDFLLTGPTPVSYTHLRAHETVLDLGCRLLLEKRADNSSHKH
eukprot:TRINITY_DN17409_c0_g1_i1.p1 TRINITY_DN17409_c0_g1~~TRINITY_DN17409_c0_g1_i1.p1  ORF type:complete len:173 (+),score=28.81 TRINITY_DN17409_c0_g1_i1:47-565(+)